MSDSGSPAFPRTAFLIGCARSGTSILGEAIAAHPRVTYLYEVSAVWKRIFSGRPDDQLSAAAAEDAEAVARLREEFARRWTEPARDLIVEKNPKHSLRVGFIAAAFPGSRFIHIIRDGRDTVASLMFRNRGPEWGHLKIPGWQDLLARYPDANHIRCAHQWRESVRLARGEGKKLPPDRYLEVRFEELVSNPQAVVSQAMDFLGLEATPEVLEAAARIQDATPGSYHARKQVRHYVDDHRVRVGRFRENLTPEQLREILDVCGDLLAELGYSP